MPVRQPHIAIAGRTRPPAQALVGLLIDRKAPADIIPRALPRWRRLTPLATWAAVNLAGIDRTDILASVDAALERHGMPARQLILLGEGIAARRTLELVLQGKLDCAGMLAIDISCEALPFPIAPTAAAIRLVVGPQGRRASDALIEALRAVDIDERVIRLNPAGADDARIAPSAAETFVLELVATVGHQARHGVRTDEIQKS